MSRLAARTSLGLLLLTAAVLPPASPAHGVGLNTNAALIPAEGGTILRVQSRFTELSDDPTPMSREVDLLIHPVTAVHSLTERFALQATLPVIYRDVRAGPLGRDQDDFGLGDVPVLAKYRVFKHDEPGETTRWLAIAGLEAPTFDTFSSDSIDPILGVVWSHQRREWGVDWDLLYQLNTAGGLAGDDALTTNLALTYRLASGEHERIGPWALFAVGELNALYLTDGSTELLGSPGLQFTTPRWILEAGVQLPIVQDLASPRLESDYTAVLSIRFQF